MQKVISTNLQLVYIHWEVGFNEPGIADIARSRVCDLPIENIF